ncbi:hypothetical protein FMUND_13246 [Fusarium mundagurra]|uniref:Uncharacterized protein n=1 Tax=Fusarium mundagurra TaxID=1567541 RepID=A0A8H5XZX4_9HYPO|nr:hypothetical protein FMUND_13246 [Fusarium mundagurra]
MLSSNQILSVLVAIAVATANAAMGPVFSTGPVGSGSWIREATSTLGHEAMGFGSSVECGASDCGTFGAHQWVDTKLILDTADPNYIQTFVKGEGVTGGEMTTSDGGKTWVISDLNIPSFTF